MGSTVTTGLGRARRIVALAFFLVGVQLLLTSLAHAERRVALVIGNSTYQHTRALPNPKHDAAAIAKLLRDIGFAEVTLKTDLDYRAMREAIRLFGQTTHEADIALVYYAGHGLELAGENYLTPVDAKLASDLDLEYEAITLTSILNVVGGARKLKLVILDACRNNPLGERMALRAGATRSVARGLARVEPKAEVLVAYSAKAATLAQDGPGRHSPFAEALLKHMATPGLDVFRVFGRVKEDVLKATDQVQEPWIYGSPGGNTIALVPASPSTRLDADVVEWQRIRVSNRIEDFKKFILVHAGSPYEAAARIRLRDLRGRAPDEKPKSAQEIKRILYDLVVSNIRERTVNDLSGTCSPYKQYTGTKGVYFNHVKAPKRLAVCISWEHSSLNRVVSYTWRMTCSAKSDWPLQGCRERKGKDNCECQLLDIDGAPALSDAVIKRYFGDYLQ